MTRRSDNTHRPAVDINKDLPRAEDGNVEFSSFEELCSLFQPWEIVRLCERAIYAMEYQKVYHRNANEEKKVAEAKLAPMFERLFPGKSYKKATLEELQAFRRILDAARAKSEEEKKEETT